MAGTTEPDRMTFFEHIEALRPHLLRSAAVLGVLFVVALCCKGLLIDGLLFGPLTADFPTNRLINLLAAEAGLDYRVTTLDTLQLINTSVAGQFNLHLKISILAALVITLPYAVWELWRFVRPALTGRERTICRRMAARVVGAALLGLCFGYLILAPLSVSFLTQYTVSAAVQNMIDIRSYLSTVIEVTIACALLFQLPAVVRLLTHLGLISSELLRRYRRHAIIVLALLAALITPPDAFSMVLVLLPLTALYEYSIRVARRTER